MSDEKAGISQNLSADAAEIVDDERNRYLNMENTKDAENTENRRNAENRRNTENRRNAENTMNAENTKNTKNTKNADSLEWEEVRTEHLIQDQWIDFRRSAYRFPDGSVFEPYYSYSRRDYVVIVASDTEGSYLCVRQFRQGIKEVTTEFPAGGIERTDGREYGGRNDVSAEDALAAAKRELLEETGYEAGEWKHLLTVPSNATISDNYAYLFAARDCRKVSGQSLDETEFLQVRKYSAQEIESMIARGEFQQAVHIMAWLLVKNNET